MTIAAGKTPYHSYAPGSAMSAEAIPFEFIDPANLVVRVVDGVALTEGVDFTIAGDWRSGAATITALAEVEAGIYWEVLSDTPDQQQLDLAESRKVPLAQYEKELDRQAIRARENRREVARAPKVPHGETGPALPSLIGQEGKALILLDSENLGFVDNDPAAAESAAVRSEAALAGALAAQGEVEVAQAAVAAAEADAESAAAQSIAARDIAVAARDAAQVVRNIYASTAAALGRGVQGYSALVGGATGTNGTFPLVVTGGTQAIAATGYFVVSGGAVTQIVIETPGHYTVDPTGFDFSASAGLAGASAVPSVAVNQGVGTYFATPSASDTGSSDLYLVEAGPVATLVDTVPATSFVNGVRDVLTEWGTRTYAYTNGSYIAKADGTLVASAGNRYFYYTLDPADLGVRVTMLFGSGAGLALAVYYDESDAFLGFEFAGTGSPVQYTEQLLTLPAGTAKIGFSGLIGSTTIHTIETLRLSSAVAERLAAQEEQNASVPSMKEALTEWVVDSTGALTTGYFISSSGVETANANFNYREFQRDADAEATRISGEFTAGAGVGLAAYYNGGTYLSSQYLGITSTDTFEDRALDWPASATKVRISQRNTDTVVAFENFKVANDLLTRLDTANGAATGPIAVIGESTAATGENGIYDELAAAFPSRDVYDLAIGGQQFLTQVMPRIGAAPVTVAITGGVIPASGAAVACVPSADFLNPPGAVDVCVQVSVGGVRCALRYLGASSSTYTIETLVDLAADVAVADGSPMEVLTVHIYGVAADPETCVPLRTALSGSIIIRGFYNDRFSTDYASLTAGLVDTVAFLSGYSTRQLWVGVCNASPMLTAAYTGGAAASEAQSYQFLTYVRFINDVMRNRAPEFFDALQFHIDGNGSEVVTVNTVDFTVLTETAATPKMQPGEPHELQAAQDLIVAALKDVMEARGW